MGKTCLILSDMSWTRRSPTKLYTLKLGGFTDQTRKLGIEDNQIPSVCVSHKPCQLEIEVVT